MSTNSMNYILNIANDIDEADDTLYNELYMANLTQKLVPADSKCYTSEQYNDMINKSKQTIIPPVVTPVQTSKVPTSKTNNQTISKPPVPTAVQKTSVPINKPITKSSVPTSVPTNKVTGTKPITKPPVPTRNQPLAPSPIKPPVPTVVPTTIVPTTVQTTVPTIVPTVVPPSNIPTNKPISQPSVLTNVPTSNLTTNQTNVGIPSVQTVPIGYKLVNSDLFCIVNGKLYENKTLNMGDDNDDDNIKEISSKSDKNEDNKSTSEILKSLANDLYKDVYDDTIGTVLGSDSLNKKLNDLMNDKSLSSLEKIKKIGSYTKNKADTVSGFLPESMITNSGTMLTSLLLSQPAGTSIFDMFKTFKKLF